MSVATYWIVVGTAVLIGAVLRIVPRRIVPNAYAADTYYHLFCASAIAANGQQLPVRLPRIVLPHTYSYPFLYHQLLALVSLPWRRTVERYTGAVCDCGNVLAFGLFGYLVSEGGLKVEILEAAGWTAALLAVAPSLLVVGIGPRAFSGSPRVVGETLYLIHMLAAYYGIERGNGFSLALSCACGAMLLITSKFGVQVLFLFAIGFTLFVSPLYLAVIAVSFVLCLIVWQGSAWRVLDGSVRHSWFYVRRLQHIYLPKLIRTLSDFPAWGKSVYRAAGDLVVHRNWRTASEWFVTERYPGHQLLFFNLPILCALAYGFFADTQTPLLKWLVVWVACSFGCFLFTKTKPFLFLGEGERYLEFAAAPAIFLTSYMLVPELDGILAGYFAYSLLVAAASVSVFIRRNRDASASHAQVQSALERITWKDDAVILPLGGIHWECLYRTNASVLCLGGNVDERQLPWSEFELVYGNYPYPSGRFREMVERYGVNYVASTPFCIKEYLDTVIEQRSDFSDHATPILESTSLVVFELAPQAIKETPGEAIENRPLSMNAGSR